MRRGQGKGPGEGKGQKLRLSEDHLQMIVNLRRADVGFRIILQKLKETWPEIFTGVAHTTIIRVYHRNKEFIESPDEVRHEPDLPPREMAPPKPGKRKPDEYEAYQLLIERRLAKEQRERLEITEQALEEMLRIQQVAAREALRLAAMAPGLAYELDLDEHGNWLMVRDTKTNRPVKLIGREHERMLKMFELQVRALEAAGRIAHACAQDLQTGLTAPELRQIRRAQAARSTILEAATDEEIAANWKEIA